MSWIPGFAIPAPNPADDVNQDGSGAGASNGGLVYVHDGDVYVPSVGRVFIGPEDPQDDGFTMSDGDEWLSP